MEVIITPQAEKDLLRLPKDKLQKIVKKIAFLESEPFLGKKLSGKLSGLRSLRLWPYRVIYLVKGTNRIYVVSVLHRQGSYK